MRRLIQVRRNPDTSLFDVSVNDASGSNRAAVFSGFEDIKKAEKKAKSYAKDLLNEVEEDDNVVIMVEDGEDVRNHIIQ